MRFINILLIMLTMVSCGTTNDARYQDNSHLERPPEIPIDKQAAEQIAVNEIEPPKSHHRGKGLKSDVYIVENSTSELRVKRSFDEVWGFLHQAILRNDLKVTDQDRSKGAYYVAYNSSGLLGSAVALFKDEQNKSTYLLKVEPHDEETSVTVSLATKEEQTAQLSPKNDMAGKENTTAQDSSQQLLELLHDTLEDDVKE